MLPSGGLIANNTGLDFLSVKAKKLISIVTMETLSLMKHGL